MKLIKIIVLCLLLAVALPSCNADSDGEKNTGILANRDVVSSIRQELEDRENSLLANEGDVFWTKSGTLWHSTYKCSYLANSKTIYHGTVEEAKLDGKQGSCERCGSGASFGGESIYEQIEENEIMQGDVFFTEADTVWHTSADCTEISKDEKLYHGNRALATVLGKTVACEECEQ